MAKRAFAGRIPGTLRPNFTASCSHLFEKRGDAWLTPREKDRLNPLRQSRPADTPLSPEQIRSDEARRKMQREITNAKIKKTRKELFDTVEQQSLGTIPSSESQRIVSRLMDRLIELNEQRAKDFIDFKPPAPSLVVNPEMDAFTKASRAKPKEEFRDVPGQAIENCPQRRATAAILSMRRRIKETKPIEKEGKTSSPKKVKGGFYKFPDITERVTTTEEPERPFFGHTPRMVMCKPCQRRYDANAHRSCPLCHGRER